jgi:hypothetical protein
LASAVLLVGLVSAGCAPTAPATKAPSTNSSGDKEQLPVPPKPDPG